MSKWRGKALELFPDMRPTVQAAATPGELWIELSARLQTHYSSSPESAPESSSDFARKVHMYALWCHSAADWHTKEAAGIEFFESIVPFAIRSGKSVYDRIVEDLVAYIGVPTIKNSAVSFGYSLSPERLEHFLKQVDEAAKRRARRSAKK
jgi:hypothetical protein